MQVVLIPRLHHTFAYSSSQAPAILTNLNVHLMAWNLTRMGPLQIGVLLKIQGGRALPTLLQVLYVLMRQWTHCCVTKALNSVQEMSTYVEVMLSVLYNYYRFRNTLSVKGFLLSRQMAVSKPRREMAASEI